ncbi:PEPxxWA-CTERM sorting domain-containing protein [Sphingomonas sp.]|uniref:PEPxxWA-CTERM sorting domain-containing protein n=1 Tax=Sphingomonas sp. TaxID=28214 RepID=UPI003CC5F8F7
MKTYLWAAAAATVLVGSAATAQTVSNTSLQNLNGTNGAGVATTTTTPTGTRTTVVGPGGGANRVSGAFTTNQWYQNNVGGGGTVGITTDYSRNGNGSAFFSTTSADSKADLQYYLSSPIALSSLSSVSFDFYRDPASTTTALFSPVFRFDIYKNCGFAGALVLENYYQANQNAPVGTWTTVSATLGTGQFWATNAALGPTFADANGGVKTMAEWIAANSTANLSVVGLEIGVGSGWTGTFSGAVDNVRVAFANGPNVNANFEVAAVAAAVPEPASWAMMIVGFGVVGFALRRRAKVQTAVRFA